MKKIIGITLSLLVFTISTVLVGCKNDPCKNITCAFSGTCYQGGCQCQVGYEGIHCETSMRDKFVGIYSINEDGTISAATQYPSVIAKDAPNLKINEVTISNFNGIINSNPVKGIVKGDSITIPSQVVNGNIIQGYGFITATNSLDQHYYQHATLKMYYSITYSSGLTNYFGFPDKGDVSLWAK
jgi:hypothetical protein